ncbi:helix-turn-helix domain-containing protein [Streptacidiphilus melanogenes]|uniref:helix-turn-helix domain-containing protein n=1 Tax=Streptacidiphilus melanogenes TaxID=411235 RepID=UPI0005AA2F3A|nr:helix-turn-helix transcriptional regulator [Streptacidiphilus melanogenes]
MRIDPRQIESRAELSAALAELFRQTGRSYLDVASGSGVSTATLHNMVSGKSLPRWRTLESVLDACGVKDAAALSAWREAHGRATAGAGDSQLTIAEARGLVPLPWATQDEADTPAPERKAHRRPMRSLVRATASLASRPWRSMRARHRMRQREVMLKEIRLRMRELTGPAEAHHYLTPRFHLVGSEGKPREVGIRELFEGAGEELVLLGAAGMGKTTQLARLAEELAAEALEELHRLGGASIRPIPMLVSLSSYRGQPLTDWLPAAINRQYEGVPEELVRGWLAHDLLLPLLDGLDQVPDAYRAECADQIRRFRTRRTGIVVGCRYDDLSIARRVGATRYVQLSTPTRTDVEEFLQKNIEALSEVHAALKANPGLGALLRSPLMLNIIHGAYRGRPAPELERPETSDRQRQKMIFDAYVRRMLQEKRPLGRSDRPERTVRWLTWLARGLQERGEDVFYLDRVDLEWLPTGVRQVLPRALPPFLARSTGELLTLLWLTIAVTSGALQTHLFDVARITFASVFTDGSQALIAQTWWAKHPERRPSLAIVFNVALTMPIWYSLSGVHWLDRGVVIMAIAWLWLLLTNLEVWYFPVFQPVEQIRWCWTPREADPSLRGRFPVRGFFTVQITVVMTAMLMYLSHVLLPGLGWGASAAALLLMAVYLLGNNFEPSLQEQRPVPNEGIRRSLRFAVLHGMSHAVVASSAVLAVLLLAHAGGHLRNSLLVAGFLGTLFGTARAYRYGGIALVRHWAIRASLAAGDDTPFRYKQFLHDAEQRILLRRLGSGYAFPHPLLQEHFATAPDALLSRLAVHQETVPSPQPVS